MRPQTEVQSAHDVLTQVLMRKTPIVLEETSELLLAECASVLCWVLGHNHYQGEGDVSFGAEFDLLVAQLKAEGGVLRDTGAATVGWRDHAW